MPDTTVHVTLPEMGESVTEGSIVEWRKKVGDYVAEGDTLVEVTTDKVDVEVPATASGVIRQLLASEGDTVTVGAVLAEIDTNGAAKASPVVAAPPASAPPATPREPRLVTVALPEMGESVTEGSIVEWQKKPGDFVNEGDSIVNVTTDKVDVEVPATVSGAITQLFAAEGATVAVGAPLAEIDANASAAARTNGAAPAAAIPKPSAATPAAAPPKRTGEAVATPQARRLARKRNISLAGVRGTGPDGLILRNDVQMHVEVTPSSYGAPGSGAAPGSALPAPPISADAKVTPLKGPAAALIG
ncbi:MAG: E3 binding domain-containing protein, partial [Candidatus Eremiobacteraeota bacterium]|nr:E3 binding domain-containing protein [Candidatus Eremiobacteraeota bacterium]